MSKIYIGVDLGKAGSIVVLKNKKIIFKEIMPIIGGELDILKIARILQKYKDNSHLVMEKFGGFFGYGKKAVVSLGAQGGVFEALSVVFKIPYTRIMPAVWQKQVWVGTHIHYKKVKTKKVKDTKKISLLTAVRLFPDENWLATKRSSVPHNGIIDAVLLAEYGRRKGF